jgi:hypothetical protein
VLGRLPASGSSPASNLLADHEPRLKKACDNRDALSLRSMIDEMQARRVCPRLWAVHHMTRARRAKAFSGYSTMGDPRFSLRY